MAKISIIIPTLLRKNVFSKTIEAAALAIEKIQAEILVINDCVEDEVVFDHPKVKIYNNTGKGVSSARNLGASLSNSPLLLFIDNDVLITEENVLRTLAVHESKQRLIINANWVYPPSINAIIDGNQFARVRKFWKLNCFKDRYIFHNKGIWNEKLFKATLPFAGFYFSIRKDDFLTFLKFNEKIAFGKEEADLSDKIMENSIDYKIDPENIVYHNEIDRITDYRVWLKNGQSNNDPQPANSKQKLKRIILLPVYLFIQINYFVLDHFPNRIYVDKYFARLLYLQSRLLKIYS